MDSNNQQNAEKDNFSFLTARKDNDSNKDWNILFNTGEVGIDTVCFSVPIDNSSVEQESSVFTNEGWDSYKDSGKIRHKIVGNLQKDYANIHIEVYPERELMKVSFNAARIITPKSRMLLPPLALSPLIAGIFDDLVDTVKPVFDSVDPRTGELIRDAGWESGVSFTRLDFARNFTIDDPVALKKALALAQPKYNKLSHMYWDASGSWTIQSQTKYSGNDRVYDKSAELTNSGVEESLGGEGTLFRFEAELKGKRLLQYGVKTLDAITNERVANALESRWDQLNWGVKIPAPNTLLPAIAHLKPKNQDELIGYLFRASQGETGTYTRSQIRRLHSLARELGLATGSPIDELGVAVRHLDLYVGGFVDINAEENKDG